MSPERHEGQLAVHDLAVARHLQWAHDFAVAGDFESAVDELLDVHALAAEVRPPEHPAACRRTPRTS